MEDETPTPGLRSEGDAADGAPRRLVDCWRCGKAIEATALVCPHCHAYRRGSAAAAQVRQERLRAATPLTRLLVVFVALLFTSVLYGLSTRFGLSESDLTPQRRLGVMVGLELVDTLLVVAGLLWIGRPVPPARPAPGRRAWVWAIAVPGLGLLLGANHAYHRLLLDYLRVPGASDDVVRSLGWTPIVIAAYCVQPAVVEELFFRRLALDTLRGVTTTGGAVAISSVMFGLAHVGAPLSIPILILIGLAFAGARVASGGLALPICLHLLHNLAVLAMGD